MRCKVRQMASGGSYELYSKTGSIRWLLWRVECDRWHEVAPMECRVRQMALDGYYDVYSATNGIRWILQSA
jgi:hypothetical protein